MNVKDAPQRKYFARGTHLLGRLGGTRASLSSWPSHSSWLSGLYFIFSFLLPLSFLLGDVGTRGEGQRLGEGCRQ